MKNRILIVEDEPNIAMPVCDELLFEGYEATVVENGAKALEMIVKDPPDLVVLDLMLPGKSGLEICREMRRSGTGTPILMLTARTSEADRIRGLDTGADDYLTKPFSLPELLARVRALLRRTASTSGSSEETGSVCCRDLRIDFRNFEAFKGGQKLDLTLKEFRILDYLARNRGRVISRDELLDKLWGEEVYVTHRTVDTHIAALRRKLEDNPEAPQYIVSMRGIGYKLQAEGEATESR